MKFISKDLCVNEFRNNFYTFTCCTIYLFIRIKQENEDALKQNRYRDEYCVKSVRIWSFFGPVFSPNAGKHGPEKLQIRKPFTQWKVFPITVNCSKK